MSAAAAGLQLYPELTLPFRYVKLIDAPQRMQRQICGSCVKLVDIMTDVSFPPCVHSSNSPFCSFCRLSHLAADGLFS